MLKPCLVSDKTGVLSVGVRAYKLSSTHSGSTAARRLLPWWASPGASLCQKPFLPRGEEPSPHRESALTLEARSHPVLRGAGCALASAWLHLLAPAPQQRRCPQPWRHHPWSDSPGEQSPDLRPVAIPPEGLWLAQRSHLLWSGGWGRAD